MRIKVPLYAVKGFLCALPISLALAVLVLGGVRLYVEHVTYPVSYTHLTLPTIYSV